MRNILIAVIFILSINVSADSFQESALKGYFEAEGYSAPGQNRFAAMIAAKVDAQRRLLEIIKGAQVTSATTIENGVLKSDVMISKVKGIVQGARMTARKYDMRSGTAMIRLAIGYKDFLNKALKDKDFKDAFYQTAKTTAPVFQAVKEEVVPAEVVYDGLIVDATATEMEPAYINRVYSDNKVVYDPTKVPQQVIVERGLASYTIDINKAKAILDTYGVKNPLIVKATATTKLKSDVVINSADATVVMNSNDKSGFLESAKIVFILK